MNNSPLYRTQHRHKRLAAIQNLDSQRQHRLRLSRAKSMLNIHTDEAFAFNPETRNAKKQLLKLTEFKEVEKANKHLLERISTIITDSSPSEQLAQRLTNINQQKRIAETSRKQNSILRLSQLVQDNMKFLNRLVSSKSHYPSPSNALGSHVTFHFPEVLIRESLFTNRNQKQRVPGLGLLIEQQAKYTLIDDRQVVLKKTVPVQMFKKVEKHKIVTMKAFLVEISIGCQDQAYIAAFDLVSDESFLCTMTKKEMKNYIQIWGDPDTLALNLRIQRNKLLVLSKIPKMLRFSSFLQEQPAQEESDNFSLDDQILVATQSLNTKEKIEEGKQVDLKW